MMSFLLHWECLTFLHKQCWLMRVRIKNVLWYTFHYVLASPPPKSKLSSRIVLHLWPPSLSTNRRVWEQNDEFFAEFFAESFDEFVYEFVHKFVDEFFAEFSPSLSTNRWVCRRVCRRVCWRIDEFVDEFLLTFLFEKKSFQGRDNCLCSSSQQWVEMKPMRENDKR